MRKVVDILNKIFEKHPRDFGVKLWNGHSIKWSRSPQFTLIFKEKAAFKKMLLRGDSFTVGTAYIEGKFDIEGDIFKAVELGDYLASLKLNRRDKLNIFIKLMTL